MRALLSIITLTSASTTNAAAQCTFTPNCDYGKGSRQYGAATTRDECCTLCSNRPGCAAGVWDGNRCWYKTANQVKSGCQHSARVRGSCIPKSVKPGPPPAPPPPPIPPLSCSINGTGGTGPVVAFVGDSITYGSGCSEWKYGFVKATNDTVGSKYDLRDCGVSGLDAVKPSHGEHGHGSYWSSAQHTESLAMKPEVVVVMLGTNDADEWCYAQNSSACPGGTSKHYASDLQNVSSNHCQPVQWQSYLQALTGVFCWFLSRTPVDAGLYAAAKRQEDVSNDPTSVPVHDRRMVANDKVPGKSTL